MIITENALDKLFEQGGVPVIPFDLMTGINIKTSCYGLFLVGLELTKRRKHLSLIKAALQQIDNLSESVAFHSLSLMYPVDDVSRKGILKLAKAVILIDDATHGCEAEDMDISSVDALMNAVNKELGLREVVIEMVTDNEKHENDELRTSQNVPKEIQGSPEGH